MTSHLYQSLCDATLLKLAWLEIKGKGSSGGVDEISIETFDSNIQTNIDEILVQLKAETYRPLPLKQINIRKSSGGYRDIGLVSIRDKIVQRAVKRIIEPILEKQFQNVSYGFRPDKGPAKAIKRLIHNIEKRHYNWFVKLDVDNCFDTIPLDTLFLNLRQLLKDNKLVDLIEIWMRMGAITYNRSWKKHDIGIPQGAVLSPLLMNFHLNELDKLLSNKEVGYIRYADDIILGCYTKDDAVNFYHECEEFLSEKLGQKFNDDIQIVHVKDQFKFLGILFKQGRVTISDEKEETLKSRIYNAWGISAENIPSKSFREKLLGIKAYYGTLLREPDLKKIDTILIECIKYNLAKLYSRRVITTKKSIREFVNFIPFFSAETENIKPNLSKEISRFIVEQSSKGTTVNPEDRISKTIKQRRKEFQRLESAGMDLILSTPGIYVGKSKDYVVVKQRGKILKRVSTNNLKTITVISMGVNFSSNLVKFCSDKNIGLSFLNFDGKPYGILTTPKFTHAKNEIAQLQAQLSSRGVSWAKAVIKGKIKNQINTLKFFSRSRKDSDPDFMEHLPDVVKEMKELLKRLKALSGDSTIEIRDNLFAIEGRAAKLYWQQVGRILDDYTLFEKRIRQGAEDLVNSMLNYGYAILYSKVWRAIIEERLNPCIGMIHSSINTNAALVYDIVEEFRSAVVDRVIISLISKGEHIEIKNGLLTQSSKRRVVEKIMQKLNSAETFRKSEIHLITILHHQVAETRRFFLESIPTYKPYVKTW